MELTFKSKVIEIFESLSKESPKETKKIFFRSDWIPHKKSVNILNDFIVILEVKQKSRGKGNRTQKNSEIAHKKRGKIPNKKTLAFFIKILKLRVWYPKTTFWGFKMSLKKPYTNYLITIR